MISQDPLIRYHEIARRAGITEKTVQRIVSQLEAAGYIGRKRSTSLSATYTIHRERSIGEPTVSMTVGELLDAVAPPTR